jgi:hypothetical protein
VHGGKEGLLSIGFVGQELSGTLRVSCQFLSNNFYRLYSMEGGGGEGKTRDTVESAR